VLFSSNSLPLLFVLFLECTVSQSVSEYEKRFEEACYEGDVDELVNLTHYRILLINSTGYRDDSSWYCHEEVSWSNGGFSRAVINTRKNGSLEDYRDIPFAIPLEDGEDLYRVYPEFSPLADADVPYEIIWDVFDEWLLFEALCEDTKSPYEGDSLVGITERRKGEFDKTGFEDSSKWVCHYKTTGEAEVTL